MRVIHVLAVDDEAVFLRSLVRRLRMRKLEAEGVESGAAALKHLAEHPTDVVVLDVKMPGMDGIQVLREIRTRHPTIEVILLTGHASVDSGRQGLEMGAFDYLIKPLELDDLMERILEAFDRRQVIREMADSATPSVED